MHPLPFTRSEPGHGLLTSPRPWVSQLFSERVRQINEATGTNLTKRFAAEAKKHFEIEADKRRVTTLQSLYYFFLFTCHLSTNRAGSLYRLAALDYIQNSDVEKVVLMKPRSSNPEDANRRRALFKTYWAIFNFEWYVPIPTPWLLNSSVANIPTNSILCSTYLKAPAIKGLPLTALPSYGPNTILDPVDVRSLLPPPNSFPSVNEISHLQYRAMSYNMKPQMPVGEELDLVPRRHLLYELSQLEGRLIPVPHDMYTEDSTVIQTKYVPNLDRSLHRPFTRTVESNAAGLRTEFISTWLPTMFSAHCLQQPPFMWAIPQPPPEPTFSP